MEINQQQMESLLERYESLLSWKRGGSVEDRIEHCLSQFRQIADNGIFEQKKLAADVKSQFVALGMIIDGLTSDGMNHGQKRVIANHVLTMLRTFVDKIDHAEFTFSNNSFDRFDFFRTDTPEKRLMESNRELKSRVEQADKMLSLLKEKHPDVLKELEGDIPF